MIKIFWTYNLVARKLFIITKTDGNFNKLSTPSKWDAYVESGTDRFMVELGTKMCISFKIDHMKRE